MFDEEISEEISIPTPVENTPTFRIELTQPVSITSELDRWTPVPAVVRNVSPGGMGLTVWDKDLTFSRNMRVGICFDGAHTLLAQVVWFRRCPTAPFPNMGVFIPSTLNLPEIRDMYNRWLLEACSLAEQS